MQENRPGLTSGGILKKNGGIELICGEVVWPCYQQISNIAFKWLALAFSFFDLPQKKFGQVPGNYCITALNVCTGIVVKLYPDLGAL
jgi:hypothetical protein